MTSKVDSSVQESTKLPSVVIGRSCLVSTASSLGSTSKSPGDVAKNWAADLRRRIREHIECHEQVNEDDIMALKMELIGILISTLQHDSHFQWSVFVQILGLIEPYKEFFDYFDSKAELLHYLERVLYHVNVHKEHLFDLQVEHSLMKVFPEHVRQIKAKGLVPVKNYCSSPQLIKSSKLPSSTHQPCKQGTTPHQYPSKHLPDGTNPYAAYIPTYEDISGAKQLTIQDLSKSMCTVALEMSSREAIWSCPLGTTALAMATVLPDTEYEENMAKSSAADTMSKTVPLTSRYMKTPNPVPKMLEEVPVMNGREAVQFFTSCNHLGKIKSLFLNLAPNRHYSPYDLITVPKIKMLGTAPNYDSCKSAAENITPLHFDANPEHYVFSTFGVLHVYPDRPAESLSLAEWQREAVLWKAVSIIPFFKNFLEAKAFHRWRANQQYTDFQRLQRRILENLLPARPSFGAALLHIARLLKELLTVPFLPMDIDKTYQLGDFENCINYKNIQAEKILDRFFKYCKLVVDFTAEGAFKKLHHCEEQVKKKTAFTKDAMYLQKKKKQERENNLKEAKRESAFLGNFVKLVDHMVVEHMFEITKTQGINFVNNVLEIDRNTPREGFFKANLVFNEHDALCISPPRECFQNALRNSLLGIPSVFISKVISFDGCVTEKDSADGNTNIKYLGHNHSDRQSLSNDHAISKNESGEVNGISSFQQDNNQTAGSLLQHVSQQGQGVPYGDKAQVESAQTITRSYLSQPDLTRQKTPTKEDDNMGVATPDLVIKNADYYSLQVQGEGFMGQYSPLSRANLEEKLLMDQEYQAAVMKQNDLMSAAFHEISNYCEINKWLNEIQQFCHKWTEISVLEFRGVAAIAVEQKLTELCQWSDRVRNFDSNFMTETGIFYVDCSAIHKGLLPKLDAIYQEIIVFVTDEAQTLAKNFAEEMNAVLKNLKNKSSNISSFAAFAKNFGDYKKNTLEFQQRADYIKSLFEVIRMSTRQLAPDEEKTEERVLASWDSFLKQMQDASEFVSTQAPLMTQELETTFQFYCKEAILQAELATSGQFLDMSNNPLKILADMKLIQEKFLHAQTKLQEVSRWKEAIMGESYNINFLDKITSNMNIRHELWKYVETSTYTIKDWKKMPLKKLNIKKALDKVTEWQLASNELKSHLPKEDKVLTTWCKQIQEFSKDLPILHKLANDALQERHWHAIFLGINESYDPNHQLTVTELMSYNLSDHVGIIHTICKNAAAEYNLEQSLNHISDFWQDQHFKLAKHFPDSILNKFKEHPKRTMSSNKRLRKLERYSQERAAAALHVEQRSLDVASDDFFILIELEELKYRLEDSRISVDAMMASPYVQNIKEKVMFWCQALREIEEITDLWIECQKKWLYLLKIFDKTDLYCKLHHQALMFEDVHSKFKDWMRVVSNDPRCLSVVSRRRGDKGYRLLQGDNLRSLFLSAIKEQEKILKDLEVFIEGSRTNFPRLYFLSNLEIVDLMGMSRNLPALIPFVQKCFPNVQNLTFALPTSMSGLNTQLDHALHSDKLEVVSVQGIGGEDLSLYTPVVATSSATKWMHSLNEVLKNTMTISMRACVQARIEEGSRQPILILEELSRLDSCSSVQEKANEVRFNFHHWLLRFPVQCVITAEAIMWEKGMTRALEKQDKDELIMLRSSLCAKLEQLVDVLQEVQIRFQIANPDRQRLELLFCGLLNQCIYHRDIMERLIESNEVTDSAFDWLKILKIRMDIRNMLRAKTVITDNVCTTNANGPKGLTKARKKSSVCKRQKDPIAAEAPKLTRTQTTVSTDHQFSACYVRQLGDVFSYDYEYLGPCNHIVMTPLTERAFLAMGHAMKTFYCGTMIGPSGTGKTETIRELSRILGRCMFTISCHESITFVMILQYLTGMVQSGCWALFDDTDRLAKGLLSVAGQQLDYLRTALRALDVSNENQYQIRGHSHFDKKSGLGDKVIRRNSLTTLHPLTKAETHSTPLLERQNTVPHGFNEKGLVTYFEDTWVAERDQRRHSIEREIEIKESDLYKSHKQPPLFYEHVKANRKHSPDDYSKLNAEPLYVHRMLGNVMLNGKLIEASSNFGCFMTLNANNPNSADIPYNFRVLMRPCALIVPDFECIISVTLQSYGYKEHKLWTKKLIFFFKYLEAQMPKQQLHRHYLREVKRVLILAAGKRINLKFQHRITGDDCGMESDAQWKLSSAEETPKQIEEHSLVFSLKEILTPRYEKLAEITQFLHILREVFPHTAGLHKSEDCSHNQQMTMAITEIFKEDHLENNDVMFSKILQLHAALETHIPVILMGPSGSGKTKVYQTLARAINMLNYKVYAPDHSKDELTADRDIQDNTTQKLKSVLPTDEIIRKFYQDFAEYPKIDVIHLFPGAMTPSELFGMFEDGMWHGGLLGKIVRDSYFMWLATKTFIERHKFQERKNSKTPAELPSILQKWLVLDGDLDPSWTEEVKTLLDDEKQLSLGNGESVLLKDTNNVIFETTDLKTASPSTISRCCIVHCGPSTTNWSALYFSWKQNASTKWLLSAAGLKILDDLVNDVIPSTVKFLVSECQTALLTDVGDITACHVIPGVTEVSAFLRILSAMLDRSLNRAEMENKIRMQETDAKEEDTSISPSRQMGSSLTTSSQIETIIPNYKEILKGMFAFSYIWAFGGHLHDRFKEKFSKIAHDALYRASHSICLPLSGLVFDYYLDENTASFVKWSSRQQQGYMKNLSGFIVTPEFDRYAYLLELLMASHQPVLLTGAPGVGKTSLVQCMVLSKVPSTTVTMSRGLTSPILQDLLMSHVLDTQSKSSPTVGTSMTFNNHTRQRHFFFVDDLSMAPIVGGYQPNVELIRSIFTVGGIYDKHRKIFHKMEEAAFIASTTLPSAPGSGLGVASHVISSRLSRQFINLTVFTPSDDSLMNLYSRPLQTWLEEFPSHAVEHHYEFAKAMSRALLDLYQLVKQRLRPCPSRAHYIFSLHDLSRVMQGIMLMSPRITIKKATAKDKEVEQSSSAPMMNVIAQLWCHEVTRCFGDRLINAEDKTWFNGVVQDLVLKYFCSSQDDTSHGFSAKIKVQPKSVQSRRCQFVSPPLNIKTSQVNDVPEDPREVKAEVNDFWPEPRPYSKEELHRTSSVSPPASVLKEEQEQYLLDTIQLSTLDASRSAMKEKGTVTSESIYPSQEIPGHTTTSAVTDVETELGEISQVSSVYDEENGENENKARYTSSASDESAELGSESPSSLCSKTSTSLPEYFKSSLDVLTFSSREGTYSDLDFEVTLENIVVVSQSSKNPSAASVDSSRDIPGTKQQESSNVKLGVTFKAALNVEREHETYYGPLLSYPDIKTRNMNLTDVIFSKFYMACHAETQELQAEKGYTGQTVEILSEALHSCLNKYNKETSQRLSLVLFSEAVHHAARLSRVLAYPKGHALLLGMGYCTGRTTLARLASFIAQCRLFEPKPQTQAMHNLNVVRTHIKQSCFHAGVNGKPTVLLVHEEMGDECLQDVCAVMAEGTVPGIYTDEEVQDIVSHLMPGGVQTKRVDKIQQALERYGKRIRQNLHVLVCLNYNGNSFSTDFYALHNKLQKYPSLIKNSFSIDFYQPWSFKAFAQVARVCLKDTSCGVIVPWNPARRDEQIEMASNGMAYIHLSAKAAIERQFCHLRVPLRIFTPLTFLEFVHMFKIVSAFLVKTEKAKGGQFEKALKKIDEAFGSIAEYKRKVSDLLPQSTSAGGVINDLVAQVEALKQSYRQALAKCKSQEEKIIKVQGPLEKLRKSTKTEFDKVNPIYLAAAKVLDKLDHGAVEELRSYPSPPEGVRFVMKAVCLLFGKPQTWEDAKSLMVDTGFFQELIFYKKDSIPDEVLTELKTFVTDPLFAPENVAQASTAASSISSWVHAVFAYSSINQKMKPHLKSLLEAENKLAKAQAQLGQKRVNANNMKANLEQYINQHKEAVKGAKAIEKQILAIERKIAQANNLMENMSVQHFLWRSELKRTRKHILSAPGDALITSACLVYHGPLSDMSRIDLLHEWLDHIKQNGLDERAYVHRDPYVTTTNLELPIETGLQQVKTFKYTSAVYDDTSYYRSELKRQDTMQTAVPEDFMDDSDDDENCSMPTRQNLAIQEIVSDFDELSEWRMQNLPTDLFSIQNALMMRACCHNRKHCWPLLIDPDNQAEMWVRALQSSQNIFTEKDVASFLTDDAIPFEESIYQRNEQSVPKSPSRGTLLTFLEANESILTDSQSLNTPICRTMNRKGSQSCHTENGGEPQNVNSVNNSCNNYYLKADSDTGGFSDKGFEVLMADDPNINFKLINAVIHGVKVLITHLERKPLDSIFRGLLLKQFYVDKEDNKIIMLGDKACKYHPNFCLYLSTSVPLFLKGDGIFKFPLNHLCVINMAMSDEAIFNRLMFETMKFEKKEFESQRRSNEKDIILHRQRLAREHEIIREKTVTLTGPLLDDNTMLDSLLVCQTNVEHNCLILEETLYMGNQLEGKFSHYTHLIKNSAVLYNVLHKMAVLHPCYYLPFYKFVEIFSSVIKSRDRGKGSLGAPQVRAQELSDAVLHTIFKYVKLMMFEEHYNLLALLVSLERLLKQHKANIKELSIFVNGFLKNELAYSSLLEQKPQWMNNEAWIDCNILESLHQPFQGLCLSIITNSQQWEEYFQNGVNLGSLVPGSALQELSLFQKCLLWKLICPHRIAQLSHALVLYELGSVVYLSDNWNIHEIYKLTDKHTPTIFILPTLKKDRVLTGTMGYPFICPASEVKQLAKEIGMEGKVRVLNFGVSSQMLEVKNAITDCLHLGHWLLLQNYHLSEELDPEFFSMLKDIIYAQWLEDDDKIDKADLYVDGRSLVTRFSPSMSANTSKIHQSFRLWITSTVDEERELPGLLIQHGLRVTCKATGNFKDLLSRSYKSADSLMRANTKTGEEMSQRFSRVMPFALLHAIIMQQCYYGRYAFVHHNFWTPTDLATLVNYFCNLSEWTKDTDAINDLSAWVYARHCQDLLDACSVHAVIRDLVQYGTFANQALPYESRRVGLLLQRLVVSFRETGDLQKTLDSIEDCSARIVSLPDEAQEQLVVHKSRILMEELVQATGAPELLLTTQKIRGVPISSVATTIITSLLDLLSTCPELPRTSSVQIIPLDSFFHQEVEGFKELLQTIHNDLRILSQAAHAEISLTAKMQSMLEDICNDDIPAAWLESTSVTCSSLTLWLSELPVKMNFVKECVVRYPAILSLNMFLRPDRLFWVILQTYAQQNFKDVTEITLDFQVMPEDLFPSMMPDIGVFIDGLELKNASWDNIKSILSDNTLCTHTTQTFPVLWAKPHVKSDSDHLDVKNELYHCPVFSARESHLNSDENIMWMIPLATLEPSTLWLQKRVALTLTSVKL